MRTSGWLPYWNARVGLESAKKAGAADVCLFHFEVNDDRTITDLWKPNASPADLKAIQKSGIPYLVSTTTTFGGATMLSIMNNKTNIGDVADRHIRLAYEYKAVGIDLDWESINFGTNGKQSQVANLYCLFISELKKRAGSLRISATIPGRTNKAPLDWQVYDYSGIGNVADEVRLMAYDYHWAGGDPGPVAPVQYVADVIAYAKGKIPPEKTILGVAGYGYDWAGTGNGKNVAARSLPELEAKSGAKSSWDVAAKEVNVTYPGHTAWVSTGRSIKNRAKLATDAGLKGISVWSLGEESLDTWDLVNQ